MPTDPATSLVAHLSIARAPAPTPEPTYGRQASWHSAARVPSSPCGPCTSGKATSHPRHLGGSDQAHRTLAAVAPRAVPADGQPHDLVRRGVEAGGHARRRGEGDVVLAA